MISTAAYSITKHMVYGLFYIYTESLDKTFLLQ